MVCGVTRAACDHVDAAEDRREPKRPNGSVGGIGRRCEPEVQAARWRQSDATLVELSIETPWEASATIAL